MNPLPLTKKDLAINFLINFLYICPSTVAMIGDGFFFTFFTFFHLKFGFLKLFNYICITTKNKAKKIGSDKISIPEFLVYPEKYNWVYKN